jgi:acyl-CoA thioester hydrolase
MDALGHVNNARFFTWLESARIALFAKVGVMDLASDGAGPILATTTCDFLTPIVYPAHIVVGARVAKIGATSITMEYAVWRREAPETIAARGSSVAVIVRYATGEKLRVPDAVRAAIAALDH